MKARISPEHEIAIYDYIYLTLLVEILEGKAAKGLNLDNVIKKALSELTKVKGYMKDHYIKMHLPLPDEDGLFINYPYSVRNQGVNQEGYIRFWRKALKNTLNKKMKQLQNNEKIVDGEYK